MKQIIADKKMQVIESQCKLIACFVEVLTKAGTKIIPVNLHNSYQQCSINRR